SSSTLHSALSLHDAPPIYPKQPSLSTVSLMIWISASCPLGRLFQSLCVSPLTRAPQPPCQPARLVAIRRGSRQFVSSPAGPSRCEGPAIFRKAFHVSGA